MVSFDRPGHPGELLEYPVDIVGVFKVRHDERNGMVEDLFFVQAYDFVVSPDEQHPLVPGAAYVYLTDEFYLLQPSLIEGPALLVPNVTPDESRDRGLTRKSDPISGSVVRPHFFWLRPLLS